MKKFIFPIFVMLALFTLLTVSCKSTAETVEETPEPVVQPEEAEIEEVEIDESHDAELSPALINALNNAKEARQRAVDFESPSYFPSEWEAAESQFNAVNESLTADTPESTINDTAVMYDEIFKKAVPLYKQAREDEILAARDEYINTGFDEVFPEFLKNADTITLQALDQYEAEDFYTAKDTAASALSEYQMLTVGGKANLARQQVIDRDFQEFDQENFGKAEEIAASALKMYEDGDKQGALENAQESLLRYNLVLSNGWVAYAGERRTTASSERELALAEKANIAARDTFREADTIYNQADSDFNNKKFDSAATLFVDSEARFAIAREETAGKREKAEQTIRQAEETIEASSETASDAERIIEGVSK